MSIDQQTRLSSQSIMIEEFNGFDAAMVLKEQAIQNRHRGGMPTAAMILAVSQPIKTMLLDQQCQHLVNMALATHFQHDKEVEEVKIYLAFPTHIKMRATLRTPAIP